MIRLEEAERGYMIYEACKIAIEELNRTTEKEGFFIFSGLDIKVRRKSEPLDLVTIYYLKHELRIANNL